MAITDIDQYAHLTESDVETLGAELDAIRRDIDDEQGHRPVALDLQREHTVEFQCGRQARGKRQAFRQQHLHGGRIVGMAAKDIGH